MLKDKLSEKFIFLIKLCCKNKTNGSVINPENEIALPISIMLLITWILSERKNWKNTRKNKDMKITKIIFNIKSLKVEL